MADLVTCPNSLTWQDVVGSVVYEDGAGVKYVNVFDSGVDISTLTPLDCDDPKDIESILLALFGQDAGGNPGLRGVTL
jgi:hypothetical protein